MAGKAVVKIYATVSDLGAGAEIGRRFEDAVAPDDYRKIYSVVSTTESNLSSMCNVPSAEVVGLFIEAAGTGGFYFNTISINISTAGTYLGNGESQFLHFSPGNSCVLAYKGDNAASVITGLLYAAVT